jgi:hypothetical protein
LKKVGSQIRDLSIGFDGRVDPIYNVKITVMQDQQAGEEPVFDWNALKAQAHPTSSFPTKQLIWL